MKLDEENDSGWVLPSTTEMLGVGLAAVIVIPVLFAIAVLLGVFESEPDISMVWTGFGTKREIQDVTYPQYIAQNQEMILDPVGASNIYFLDVSTDEYSDMYWRFQISTDSIDALVDQIVESEQGAVVSEWLAADLALDSNPTLLADPAWWNTDSVTQSKFLSVESDDVLRNRGWCILYDNDKDLFYCWRWIRPSN